MPCFKGIAVSIHANGSPLPEYGMQKQSRFSRISTYIPVPQPQLTENTTKPEPAKFAISITLLTPGLAIPYSTPKPTPNNSNPRPQYVGGMPPSAAADSSRNSGVVSPYVSMTNSDNETIAAYIYFDGRAKEEVATLLRPGEETWVNSRWVQVPDSEGGGLAEREFLFREVSLERWLNGLDLQGHDAAEKLEKRRQKFDRRRRRQKATDGVAEMEVEKANGSRDTLRYAADDKSPVEAVFDRDDSDSVSSDDELPEATGQIKVAMFRVIASGEIKKGEYSPQFDAHDDDDDESGNKNSGVDADVEHTTSFAKPKTLDPKTISTQTVTGIDGPDKPYAVFTFFYRGERQLQKMGLVSSRKTPKTPSSASKRRSGQLDFSNLGPLKTTGTVGFTAFRDQDTETSKRRKSRKKSVGSTSMLEDSDDDDDDEVVVGSLPKMAEVDEKEPDPKKLAPEDAKSQGELAEGLNRIRLKRQHSAEPESLTQTTASTVTGAVADSPAAGGNPVDGTKSALPHAFKGIPEDTVIGSPLKKHRASMHGDSMQVPRSSDFPMPMGDVLAKAEAAVAARNAAPKSLAAAPQVKDEEEEEL
ncbi:hypothetical protein MKZ38_004299 [Zalerion maritima]|uniref:DUF7918 domain-containing protein n=1 Tax=Zalerion maritima TaxID=339359 RepID=A0AAD5RMF1_9PEZI|nr:hypothetical protein MKZ38_004299 [Zalerion maritima]